MKHLLIPTALVLTLGLPPAPTLTILANGRRAAGCSARVREQPLAASLVAAGVR